MRIGTVYTAEDGSTVQLQALVTNGATPNEEGRWQEGDIDDLRILSRSPASPFPIVYDWTGPRDSKDVKLHQHVALCRDDRSFVDDGIIRERGAW